MRDSGETNDGVSPAECDGRDKELFLSLLREHEAQLFGFLCAISRNFQDAEDSLQQTVMTMWRKFSDFEPGSNFIGWGCRIARYEAINLARSRREQLLDDDVLELLAVTQEAQDPAIRAARRQALGECLNKLGRKDRELVQAAYTSRESIKELAEQLERSAAGVYNSLARIRSTLFRCIQATVAREGYA